MVKAVVKFTRLAFKFTIILFLGRLRLLLRTKFRSDNWEGKIESFDLVRTVHTNTNRRVPPRGGIFAKRKSAMTFFFYFLGVVELAITSPPFNRTRENIILFFCRVGRKTRLAVSSGMQKRSFQFYGLQRCREGTLASSARE